MRARKSFKIGLKFKTLAILLQLHILSCSSIKTTENLNLTSANAMLFGCFKVYFNKTDVTNDSILILKNGDKIKLRKDGFIAFSLEERGFMPAERIKIEGQDLDYPISDLSFKIGPVDSRTYFGHISLNIYQPPANAVEMNEKWSWQVIDSWEDAETKWTALFANDVREVFIGLAESTALVKIQSRDISGTKDGAIQGL